MRQTSGLRFERRTLVVALKGRRRKVEEELVKELKRDIAGSLAEARATLAKYEKWTKVMAKTRQIPIATDDDDCYSLTRARERLEKYDNAISILELAINDEVPQSLVDVRNLL